MGFTDVLWSEIAMIRNKKELRQYMKIDQIMNGVDRLSWKTILFPNYNVRFLAEYRKTEYYSSKPDILSKLLYVFHRKRCNRQMLRLGISIAYNVFGYGLVIPHHGTIVVGAGNKIGNFCVLHTSTCITAGKKVIGDGMYLSTGAKIINDITIGDYISIGANAVVNKDILTNNCLYAGIPAKMIKESEPWFIRDGEEYLNRVIKCKKVIDEA